MIPKRVVTIMLQEKHKLSYLTFLILARFQDPQISEQRSLSLIFYALALSTFYFHTLSPDTFYCVSFVFFAGRKGGGYGIFRGDKRLEADFDRPVDGEVGIVPDQGAFHVGPVGCGDFVVEVSDIAEN